MTSSPNRIDEQSTDQDAAKVKGNCSGISVRLHELKSNEPHAISTSVLTMIFNRSEELTVNMERSDASWQETCMANALVGVCPPNSVHTVTPLSQADFVVVEVEKEFISKALDVTGFNFDTVFNVEDSFLVDISEKLLVNQGNHGFTEETYAESLGIAAIVHLSKKHGQPPPSYSPKGRLNANQLKMVIDYAYSCMQSNIGLQELAGIVHLSPYHFGRLFKQTVGLSPYKYILQLKIERAKKLIRQRSGPISEIAYQLNFSDQSHFSNAFRKATGISPRQFLQTGTNGHQK